MSQRGVSTVTVVVVLAVALVLVLGAAGVGAYMILRNRPTAAPAPLPVQPNPAPSPVAPPVQPHQPAQPPAPPAAADVVTQFAITAISPTEVAAGEPVKFKMTFAFNGAQKTKLPMQMAWRVADGELTYGKVYEEEASPGQNTSEGWSFTSPQSPGTKFKIYGVARSESKVFITATPVVMTITGPAAQPAPPAPQPAGGDLIANLQLTALSPTEVRLGEKVKMRSTFEYRGPEKTQLESQMAFRKDGGDLVYSKVYPYDAVPGGPNSDDWTPSFSDETPPGTKYSVFVVLKAGGKTYMSQQPVVVTITGPAAQPAAQPAPAPQPAQQPAPAQPAPAPQPAPPPGQGPAGPGPLPAPPPAPGLPRTGPPLQPEVELQIYHDPGRRFTLDYPVGWRVQTLEGGFVAFFKDHPQEGTSFLVHPWANMQATLGGREAAQLVLKIFRGKYPDTQVLGQDIRRLSRSGVIVDAAILELAWTNLRGERMRGRVAVVTAYANLPGVPSNQTTLHYWHYQAPEVAWEAMTPVFTQMYQSYAGQAYVTSPP